MKVVLSVETNKICGTCFYLDHGCYCYQTTHRVQPDWECESFGHWHEPDWEPIKDDGKTITDIIEEEYIAYLASKNEK